MRNDKFLKSIELLKKDHKSDGWPAIQMKDINRLLNIIKDQQIEITYLKRISI
jgi:hypothetical protein